MPSPKATVTQSEIARCLKAARAAGYEGCRVEYEKPVLHQFDFEPSLTGTKRER